MIFIRESSLNVSGRKTELMAETAGLLQSLVLKGVCTWDEVDTIVKAAKMSPEELEKAAEEAKEEMTQDVIDLINKFIEEL